MLKQVVEKTDEPLNPRVLPNNSAKHVLIRGSIIVNVYTLVTNYFLISSDNPLPHFLYPLYKN
jgi:hypothetical protein